ncbi:MAG: hypothetical protein ACK2UL_02630, partial [Anaerolineae bacterium]
GHCGNGERCGQYGKVAVAHVCISTVLGATNDSPSGRALARFDGADLPHEGAGGFLSRPGNDQPFAQ